MVRVPLCLRDRGCCTRSRVGDARFRDEMRNRPSLRKTIVAKKSKNPAPEGRRPSGCSTRNQASVDDAVGDCRQYGETMAATYGSAPPASSSLKARKHRVSVAGLSGRD